MADMPPPVSPLAAAQARAGVTKPSRLPSLRVEWDGAVHTIAVGQFSIREKYTMRAVLKGKGLPIDDEDLLAAAAIWVYLNRLDSSVMLDDVLDGVVCDSVAPVDAEPDQTPEG